MTTQGLHLLLTYKCNARCRHCFLSSGPERNEVFPQSLAEKIIADSLGVASIDHLFIEGGEPFLYPELMLSVIKSATASGFWIGALTNGFWAATEGKAMQTLKPLIEAGLKSLSISTDAWHEEFVPVNKVKMAADAARSLGLQVDVMFCRVSGMEGSARELEKAEEILAPALVHSGGVVCRGRASSSICGNGPRDWNSLTDCGENLAAPGRVHIDPNGDIHLCQGLLIGENARQKGLRQIFDDYQPEAHPIVAGLNSGGPAGLAEFAQDYGWRPRHGYVDGCQLCFEVRSFLRARFPTYIGPETIYTG